MHFSDLCNDALVALYDNSNIMHGIPSLVFMFFWFGGPVINKSFFPSGVPVVSLGVL